MKSSFITKKNYITSLFLLFILFSSCQNSENQNPDFTNSQFNYLDNTNFLDEINLNNLNYEVFSDYENLANQLQLKNLENAQIDRNILNNDTEFNSLLIPTLVGIATLIAISSSNTGYNNSTSSDYIDMDSEWIE